MKALFLQTKICEISQIRINLNSLGLVVNKHGQVETYNQTLVTQTSWRFISKSNFNTLDVVFNNFIETIHICHMSHHRWKCVAVPNQVVGGRVSLLNKGNFCQCMVARFRADTLRDKGRTAFQRPSLQSQSWLVFHLASGFCLGVIATFAWLLWDIDTQHPGK